MKRAHNDKILARKKAGDFIGRDDELAALLHHAESSELGQGLKVTSSPGAGGSELLTQAFDTLYMRGGFVVPFYFAFEHGDTDAARRFVHELILQVVSFRRKDPSILFSSAGLAELAELALPGDGRWIDRLTEFCSRPADSEPAFVRTCLSAIYRARANGVEVFPLIDNIHNAPKEIRKELSHVFGNANFAYVIAGRRNAFGNFRELRSLELSGLSATDYVVLVERLAQRTGLGLSEASRDLIAIQMEGNPLLLECFFVTAAQMRVGLESFEQIEKVYAESLFNGALYDRHADEIQTAAGLVEMGQAINGLLYETLHSPEGMLSAAAWQRGIGKADEEIERLLEKLEVAEVIEKSPTGIKVGPSRVLRDNIEARFRVDVAGENKTLAFGRSLAEYIRRAPELMARAYRAKAAIGIGELLRSFRSQTVPLALIDYGKFRDEYKGAPDAEILSDVAGALETITLPRVFFVADAVEFYKPIEVVSEKKRSAVALGFETFEPDEAESAWIAAEIDSKLEASKELAEFWCDRLEMVALMCDFQNYRLWLVSPEGFTRDALDVLRQRNAYGSSRRQFELLRELLGRSDEAPQAHEYEIVMPMSEDAELIAAHAAEDIAKRHNFDPRSINQIKTALVEACINAAEHSLSPDGKIYQKFRIEDDKIVITVSNRGLRLAGQSASEAASQDGRRGWGLTLMRRLMDDVTVEQVDDGTRISMTKYLKHVD